MSDLTIYGEVLTANAEERTISGLLLPWEEVGHTSAGSLIASKGTLTLPSDPSEIFLNLQHLPDSRVGRAISLEEREDGLHATFRIAKTTAGNDLLEEVKEGLRAHLSIEISKPKYENGRILAGLVSGAAAVCTPAFKSAAVYQLTAADNNPTPETETTMDNITPETNEVSTPVQAAPIFAASDKVDLGKVAFHAVKAGGAQALTAALADQVTTSDAGKVYLRDQQLGEVWEARKAERPLANAIQNKALTSLTVVGNKKNRTFVVADWAGNKAELPTSTYSTELVTKNAAAMAGAVDIAMELIEFGSEDIIADLYESAVESYVKKSEDKVRLALIQGGTGVESTMGVPGFDNTTPGAATAGNLFAIVDDAARRLGLVGARISHISVSSDYYAELINLPASDAPWWLQNQGSIDLGNRTTNAAGISFSVDNNLANGQVLIFDSRAATLFESKTFTYKALDVAHGGVDFSVIKFHAILVNDPAAVLVYAND